MKTTCFTIALMMSVLATPVESATPAWDKAIVLSAQDSKASLADLCYAVYQAAKENPEKAPALYEAVIAQRTNWNASQCYALLRAVLLVLPFDVGCNIGAYTRKYQDAKGSAVRGVKVHRARYSATIDSHSMAESLFYALLDVVYNASISEGVADSVVASILPTMTGVYESSVNAAEAHGLSEAPVLNDALPLPDASDIVPTPGDTSPDY